MSSEDIFKRLDTLTLTLILTIHSRDLYLSLSRRLNMSSEDMFKRLEVHLSEYERDCRYRHAR